MVLEISDYIYDNFLEITTRKLANENIGLYLTKFIGKPHSMNYVLVIQET